VSGRYDGPLPTELGEDWKEAIRKHLEATATPRCCGRFMARRAIYGLPVHFCDVCETWTTEGVPPELSR
jgi:hypothetical protein